MTKLIQLVRGPMIETAGGDYYDQHGRARLAALTTRNTAGVWSVVLAKSGRQTEQQARDAIQTRTSIERDHTGVSGITDLSHAGDIPTLR